jgi:hypothetical protein
MRRRVSWRHGGSRGLGEAADVLIRVWIERPQPLAGTAATEGAEPVPFDGCLELLRVISELVAAAPLGSQDADTAEESPRGNQAGDDTRLHAELPARAASGERPGLGLGAARRPGAVIPDLNIDDLDPRRADRRPDRRSTGLRWGSTRGHSRLHNGPPPLNAATVNNPQWGQSTRGHERRELLVTGRRSAATEAGTAAGDGSAHLTSRRQWRSCDAAGTKPTARGGSAAASAALGRRATAAAPAA